MGGGGEQAQFPGGQSTLSSDPARLLEEFILRPLLQRSTAISCSVVVTASYIKTIPMKHMSSHGPGEGMVLHEADGCKNQASWTGETQGSRADRDWVSFVAEGHIQPRRAGRAEDCRASRLRLFPGSVQEAVLGSSWIFMFR